MIVRHIAAAALALVAALATGAAHAADAPAAPTTAPPTVPSAAAEKKNVVVLDLEAVGVGTGEAALVSGLVVDALSKYESLSVLQKADIQQMASFEADKQALGCSEASCLAEIAGALGASYVVFGRVGTLDGLVLVQLNLFDASAGKPVARQDIRADRLAGVAPQVPHAVGILVQPLTGLAPPDAPVPVVLDEGPSPLMQGLRWGGLGTAGVALVAGGVTTGVAGLAVLNVDDASVAAKDRNMWKGVGVGMVVATAVAAAVVVVGGAAFGASFVGGP